MKTYVELGLVALLTVLVYEKPKFLANAANTTLGIVIMIVSVGLLAKQYGINSGLLAAIIMILLQESDGFSRIIQSGEKHYLDQSQLHGSGEDEYVNDLKPAKFPVTGADQIGLSRRLKTNALNATMSASQQVNGCTNNGGGIVF
jgi:hypothetical protein